MSGLAIPDFWEAIFSGDFAYEMLGAYSLALPNTQLRLLSGICAFIRASIGDDNACAAAVA